MPPAGAPSENADRCGGLEAIVEGDPGVEVVLGEAAPLAAGDVAPDVVPGDGEGLPKPLEVELPPDPNGAAPAGGGAGGAEGPLEAGAGGAGVALPATAGAAPGPFAAPGAGGTCVTSRPML
jgi:hypothetical protein